jgi:hypothetical protein
MVSPTTARLTMSESGARMLFVVLGIDSVPQLSVPPDAGVPVNIRLTSRVAVKATPKILVNLVFIDL